MFSVDPLVHMNCSDLNILYSQINSQAIVSLVSSVVSKMTWTWLIAKLIGLALMQPSLVNLANQKMLTVADKHRIARTWRRSYWHMFFVNRQ